METVLVIILFLPNRSAHVLAKHKGIDAAKDFLDEKYEHWEMDLVIPFQSIITILLHSAG